MIFFCQEVFSFFSKVVNFLGNSLIPFRSTVQYTQYVKSKRKLLLPVWSHAPSNGGTLNAKNRPSLTTN